MIIMKNTWGTKRFFGLSLALAKAGFKLRNEGSYLGILWYLLNPLLLFLLLFLVFNDRLGNEIPFYPLYLLLGIIMFNFFQDVSSESAKVIISYGGLIKSINFDKKALVCSILFKKIFAHVFEIFLFAVLLFVIKGNVAGLLFYPLIFIIFALFSFGICLLLSAWVVYFTDLDNIWMFFVRLLWLATPIFYSIGGQAKLFVLNLFNPIYFFITLAREILIYNKAPELWLIFGAIFYTLSSLFLGIYIFNKLKDKFAEMI
jgi:ABC-type polysaccharide/polyol phosphate export permease